MAKLTLADITSGYQTLTAYNENNALLEAAIENTLSRDGTSPNQMSANLDLNSYNINNVATLNASSANLTSLVLNGQAVALTTVLTGGLDATEVTYNGGVLDTFLDGRVMLNDEPQTIESTTANQLTVQYDSNNGLILDVASNGDMTLSAIAATDTLDFADGLKLLVSDTNAGARWADDVWLHFGAESGVSGYVRMAYDSSDNDLRVSMSTGATGGVAFDVNGSDVFAITPRGTLDFTNTTRTANTRELDDYAEGAFNPVALLGSGSITFTTNNDLIYTKIGRMVHVQGEIEILSVSSPSGSFSLDGFPYNMGNFDGTSERAVGTCWLINPATGSDRLIMPYMFGFSNQVSFYELDQTTMGAELQVGTKLAINFIYTTSE